MTHAVLVDSKKNGRATKTLSTGTHKVAKTAPIRKPTNTHTKVDIEVITTESVKNWQIPGFQRTLTITSKVRMIAEQIVADQGQLPGIITIGIYGGKYYLIDGQHRVESFRIAVNDLKMSDEGIVTVKYMYFDEWQDMADEFVKLNSHLVSMKPDDHLRALEEGSPALQYLRKHCPFIGYGNVRRGKNPTTCISMSVVLRAWRGSTTDTPIACGTAAQELGRTFTLDEATACAEFMNVVMNAWGRDPEYARLWSALNLTLCAWLYRRVVSDKGRSKQTPTADNTSNLTTLTKEEFTKCMMSLSAKAEYMSWLVGRTMNERDRGPCFERIKRYVQARIRSEIRGKRARLPSPDWSNLVTRK